MIGTYQNCFAESTQSVGRDVENDIVTGRNVLESFDRFRPSGDGETGDQ